jgi:uncharacterized membrane protein YiaA
MKDAIAHLFILSMAVTFFILAWQAEPISAGFGYVFGTLLTIAFLLSLKKIERR